MRDGPHVAIACAMSLDGKLATAARDPVGFTSRLDRARLHALRDGVDALLSGGATIRAEDPPLLPDERRSAGRVARGLRALPARAVASASLDLPVGRALAPREGSPVYVFTVTGADPGRRAALEARGVRVRAFGPTLDFAASLRCLASEEGVGRILAEGGGELNFALLEAGLVDALEVTLCPVVIGGARAPTLADGAGFSRDALLRATLVAHEAQPTGELFLRYALGG